METFKIKISPEVLRNELTTQTYSGNTFGYYSGLSYVLSSGTVNLGTWRSGNPADKGNLGADYPLSLNSEYFYICKTASTNFNWSNYLLNVKTGSTISFIYENLKFELLTTGIPISANKWVTFPISAVTVPTILPNFRNVELSITQPDTSQLIDLSIPILLKQDYEDIGYYSPFDGYISQLFEDVNFTFTASTAAPFDVLIYNTSKSGTTYLKNTTYRVDWGDFTPIENVEVYIPESVLHSYVDIGVNTGYTISLTGYTTIGLYVIRKNIQIPFVDIPNTNPYGTISFISNNNSWSATPSSQNFIGIMDSENTIDAQSSWNFVDVPYIVSGFTQSRLEELKVYGTNPYINDLVINLPDGTTGVVNSQSPEYTGYTINNQSYIDFSAGTSVFVAQSYGFSEVNITATTITKLEYLMNVIEQPIIQSNVFIERGKISGMENFRRIGEVNNTGSLKTYGYKFFDVRNYNDI
jgi:hypothetical protein